MAGITVKSTGALLDGRYPTVIPSVLRRWTQGVFRDMQKFAREIAPVDTGRYRASLVFRTRQSGMRVEGELYSTDIAPKVAVIERGYDPAGPRGHYRRRGVYVFRRTFDRSQGLLRSQERVLASDLARELSR